MTVHWKMLKWLKFQSQSKTLDFKLIFLIFTVVLVSTQPLVFANVSELKDNQKNLEIGQFIQSEVVIFEIDKTETVHVKHIIKSGDWGGVNKHIVIIDHEHSNLEVTDEDGDPIGYGISGNTFEESEYVVLTQKLGGIDVIVEYDLENFLVVKDNLWFKEIFFPFNIQMEFPEYIENIFVNSRPVDISEASGINCIGCKMTLEFMDNEKILVAEIPIDDMIQKVEIISNKLVNDVTYIDEFGVLEFKTSNSDQYFIATIPFDIILNPFEVYWTEIGDNELEQTDKIRKTEFSQDSDSVRVSFKSDTLGRISIVGATMDDHEKLAAKIEKRSVSLDDQVSTKKDDMNSNVVDVTPEDIFAEWEKTSPKSSNNSEDTLVYLIIGVVVAVIIIGIVIKMKK